jgi:hypothetical protein
MLSRVSSSLNNLAKPKISSFPCFLHFEKLRLNQIFIIENVMNLRVYQYILQKHSVSGDASLLACLQLHRNIVYLRSPAQYKENFEFNHRSKRFLPNYKTKYLWAIIQLFIFKCKNMISMSYVLVRLLSIIFTANVC